MREGFVNDGMFDWSQPVSSQNPSSERARARDNGITGDGAAEGADHHAREGKDQAAAVDERGEHGERREKSGDKDAGKIEKGEGKSSKHLDHQVTSQTSMMNGAPTDAGDRRTKNLQTGSISEGQQEGRAGQNAAQGGVTDRPAQQQGADDRPKRRSFLSSMFGCWSKSSVKN